jgi:O-6-methylguanine DNA methyltransferase
MDGIAMKKQEPAWMTDIHIPGWGWLACAFSQKGLVRSAYFYPDRLQARQVVLSEISNNLNDRVPVNVAHADTPFWRNAFSLFFSGGASAADPGMIPLDDRDWSPFQRDVYRALIETVAWGECISYGDLASRAGHSGAARAVGSAMARNRWAPFVPCHRVTGAHGRLGGFSSHQGLDMKKRLLSLERRPLNAFEDHMHPGARPQGN